MSQIEGDTAHSAGNEDSVEGEGGKEGEREGDEDEQMKGREEDGRKGGDRTEHGGGRFAGVGDFEPTVHRMSKKRKVTLPLFRSKPEAALRWVSTTSITLKDLVIKACCHCTRFSVVPRQRHPIGASPSEISRHHMDLSYTLESVMATNHAHREPEN